MSTQYAHSNVLTADNCSLRALNERSLLIRELLFPRTKTNGDVYIDDLVILSVLQFTDVRVDSSPIEVQ